MTTTRRIIDVDEARRDLAYAEARYPEARWKNPVTGESGLVVEVYRKRLARAERSARRVGRTAGRNLTGRGA